MNLHLYPIHQAQRNQSLIIHALNAIDAIAAHHDLAQKIHLRLDQIQHLINQPITLHLNSAPARPGKNSTRKQGRR